MSETRALAASAAVASVLAVASPAHALIVPERGLADVTIGMERKQVRSLLGAPARALRVGSSLGPAVRYDYPALQLHVRFVRRAGGVFSVETTSRRERTRSGLGVGTPRRRLRHRLRQETCHGRRRPYCMTATGQARTVYELRRGRVHSIEVRLVPNVLRFVTEANLCSMLAC